MIFLDTTFPVYQHTSIDTVVKCSGIINIQYMSYMSAVATSADTSMPQFTYMGIYISIHWLHEYTQEHLSIQQYV